MLNHFWFGLGFETLGDRILPSPLGSLADVGVLANNASTEYRGGNWANPDTVAEYVTPAGQLAVVRYQPGTTKLLIDGYDPTNWEPTGAIASVDLNGWPKWGGFYSAPDGFNYVLVGRDNHSEDNDFEVVAVQRYDPSWTHVGTAYVRGNSIYEPFGFGHAHMTLASDRLVVHMSRLFYAGGDGVHHQANLTFEVNTATMEAATFAEIGGWSYSSHSFQQLVTTSGTSLVVVDHGDAFPRAIKMGVTANYPNEHSTKSYNLLEFTGTIGKNATGATVNSLVSGPQGVVVLGSSVSRPDGDYSENRNIFAISADPATGTHAMHWLTSFAPDGTDYAREPRTVAIGGDLYAVLFSVVESGTDHLEYRLIDSAANVLAAASFDDIGYASIADPVLLSSTIYWVGNSGNQGYLFGLDVTDPAVPVLPSLPNTAPTISDIVDRSIVQDTILGPVNFTIGDAETASSDLILSATSSNTALVPAGNIVFGGSLSNRTITVTPAPNASGAATITVTVTDAEGLTASDTFLVTVTLNTPPTITDVTNQSSTGSPVGPLAFTIGDAQTAPGSLVVTRNSSNSALLPLANIVLGGSGANRTVIITPVSGQSGTATVTLTVTDEGGLTTTDTFTFTVTLPNTPPTISDVTNQVSTGSPVGPLAFTIGDTQTAPDTLVVTRTSSNFTLLPLTNIVLGGSGANRTVTVFPVVGLIGTVTVTLTVTDEGGLTATDTFVLTVAAPNTPPTISDVADQSSTGSPVGPLAFTVGDTQTAPGSLTVTRSSSNTTLLPLANIVLGGSGANRTVTITPAAGQTGTATVTLTVTDEGGLTGTDTFVLTVTNPNTGAPATLIGFKQFSVGADGVDLFNFYDPDGTVRFTGSPFLRNPVSIRTAAGDFTGDGIADIVVGTGPGGPTHVEVINGATLNYLFSVDPFEASFTGGVYVAAGDLNGDGVADLVITPDEGGGPRVRAFTGTDFTQIADFFGIDDKNFRGGARASIGDLNGDGSGDLIVVAGFGGGPRVAAFDGAQLGSNDGPKLFGDFFAFEQTLRNGIFVAAGDVNGDGFADLVAGGGPGGGPRVYILDGQSLMQNGSGSLVPLGNFFAGNPASRGGVRVAIKNLDNDTKADVVTGAGAGAGSRVTAYLGKNITPTGTPPAYLDFDAFAGFGGGVFVG